MLKEAGFLPLLSDGGVTPARLDAYRSGTAGGAAPSCPVGCSLPAAIGRLFVLLPLAGMLAKVDWSQFWI